MTDQIPVKAVKTGSTVTALAEFGPGDLIPAEYLPATGGTFHLSGAVATYADLPADLTAADAGAAWMTNSDGRVYVWSGTAWPAEGTAPVLQGPPGQDAALPAGGAAGQVLRKHSGADGDAAWGDQSIGWNSTNW